MTLKTSPRAVLVGCLALFSSVIAALFSSENRDYLADKMLLGRSYQNWPPLGVTDLKGP